MSNFNFISHRAEIESRLNNSIGRMLNEWGIVAQNFTEINCPVDTGRLRASIVYETDLSTITTVVGTNVEYAPIVETNDKAKHPVGKAHFMRDAVANKKDVYFGIAGNYLKSI